MKDSEARTEIAFKEPRWRDVPCIFLFVLFLVGLVVIACIDLSDYSHTKCYRSHYGDPWVALFRPEILGIVAVCNLLTFVGAALYYTLAAACPKQFLGVSMAIELAVSLGCAVFHLAQHQWLSGTFSTVWLVFSALLYWGVQRFVKRATGHLAVVVGVAARNPSMLLICTLGAILCAAWSVLIAAVTLASFGKAITSECSARHAARTEGQFLAVVIYLGITNYLFVEAVKAVVRISVCYTYGWWCFVPSGDRPPGPPSVTGHRPNTHRPTEFPSIPYASWLGLLAGLSYSFGSVCFSSIWLALLKLLAQLLAAWSQTLMVNSVNIKVSEDVSLVILAWILSNCVTYLDVALCHFTNYVMVYIAVDNVSYLEGFRRAAELVVSQGVNAIACDCLAAGALTFAPWCVGMAVALGAYVYMRFIQVFPPEGAFFIGCYVMLVSIQISSILLTVLSSGVQTVFVAVASEPERVRRVHPHLYSLLKD